MALSLKNVRKRKEINKSNKSRLKTALKSVKQAILINKDQSDIINKARTATSILAKTAQKGSINKKKQARLTSRLMKKVNKLVGG